ncbi:AI-2E family transporter [Sphingosinicella sp.]|uniref:AI-2E family transporter n=1 Tax=Sphingosinicella sp. TaxID=1917971 RepID=UPI004037FD59
MPPPRTLPPPTPASAIGLVLAAAAAVVVLWFLYTVAAAILLLFFAIVVAIALSGAVDWLAAKGVPRKRAAVLTLLLFFGVIALICALVIPRLVQQIVVLANNLPRLILQVQGEVNGMLANYPDLQRFARFDPASADLGGAAMNIFAGVGAFSLSLLGFAALLIIFFSTVVYIVLDPIPLLHGYIGSLPRNYRAAGMRAYRRATKAVIGWAQASLVVGAIQALLVFLFLTWLGMPGALVWAALAFFSDFIPRIGGYIMAAPPMIIALGDGPLQAFWVGMFYLASNEILGSVVAPKIRGETMAIHPVAIIFFTVAFALAFGLIGAIVATPAAAFASAFYSEFYMKRALRRAEY